MEKWQVENVFAVPSEGKLIHPSSDLEKRYRRGYHLRHSEISFIKYLLQRFAAFFIRFF